MGSVYSKQMLVLSLLEAFLLIQALVMFRKQVKEYGETFSEKLELLSKLKLLLIRFKLDYFTLDLNLCRSGTFYLNSLFMSKQIEAYIEGSYYSSSNLITVIVLIVVIITVVVLVVFVVLVVLVEFVEFVVLVVLVVLVVAIYVFN